MKQFLSHAAALLLALCLAAAAAPMALATTPQEEAVLATGQRSMNKPEGVFTVPETPAGLRLFHPLTLRAGRLLLDNALEQLRTGQADPDAMRRIMAYAPIAMDEELPPVQEWDDPLRNMLEYGVRSIYIALRETDRPGVYQIVTLYYNRDGEARWAPQNIEYDSNTGWIYDTADIGLLGTGFDYNVVGYLVRATPDSWERSIGFNWLFDTLAPLLFVYVDGLRFTFSYNGHDWALWFWKGVYLLSNGAEVGIYEKDPVRPLHWNASDTMLDISMKVYQGDTLFFDYGTQRTWWTGGFKYGSVRGTPLVRPKQLRLTGTILFEEQEMLDAFLVSFEENKPANMTGSAQGLLFSFDWAASA